MIDIPKPGFGTWQISPDDAARSVEYAMKVGFRHIDCAASYDNEEQVGAGIKAGLDACGLERKDLFVTSKVWNTNRGYDKTRRSLEKSLKDLGLDYLDLYLIHWPANPFQFDTWKQLNLDTWRAMEDAREEGLVRNIGLSNFMPRHMIPLMENARVAPSVDQIEYHPGWIQKECVDFCKQNSIVVEAWSPLGQGSALGHPLVIKMAEKYGCTASVFVLAWCIHNGVVPLTRSVKEERIAENFSSVLMSISDEDAELINALLPFGGKCRNPDLVAY